MKFVLGMFEKMRPQFEDGGLLNRLKPVFDASFNFMFSPEEPTEVAPHVRDPLDVKRFMSMVIIAVLPCVLMAIHHNGLRIIAMIIVSYAAGGVIETIFAVVRKEPINEGFLVTGMLFPLILPPGIPLWMVAVGVMFGVLVGKEVFGGTGFNLFNPALVGRCFLTFAHPTAMASGWITPGSGPIGRALQWVDTTTVDAVSAATPLTIMKNVLQGNADAYVSVKDMFLGSTSGCAGSTSALAILLGGAFLIAVGVANWRTVVGILGSFIALGLILQIARPAVFAPVSVQIFAGGLFFGAFFMATDPVTSPMTDCAKWMYGIIIGVTALLIRNLSGYPDGVMFGILLGNIVAPILDEGVIRGKLRRLASEG